MQRGSEGSAAFEAMLERGYFWHLSGRPESARSYRPPKNDILLANIVAKRLVPGWPVPLDHQLAAGYIREGGKIKAGLFNKLIWLPLTPHQARLVAQYISQRVDEDLAQRDQPEREAAAADAACHAAH